MIERSPIRPGATKLIARVDRLLDDAYRSPEADLGNQGDPLDEAIYIILSFQTDLARFRRTWRRLCATYSSWEALERAPTRDVSRALRDGGLQRQKATTIKRLLSRVRELSGSLTLDSLKGMSDAEAERLLTHLPGLSWKGARCVLLYSLGRDVFPVDGNTFRILRRVGVLRNGAVYRRKPLHDELQRIVHPERRRSLHVNLVVHGQRACRPTAPHCTTCPLRRVCATNLGSRGPRSRTRS